MRKTHAELAARALLTAAALLPYWRLLTFSVVFVTDDYFASDIFNGELPGRVLSDSGFARASCRSGRASCAPGIPLAGSPADPIGLALFTLLPPAPALDALVIVLLLVAAHGTYSLARRFGSDRIGAVLAGIAFAGSGYIACQLKHLSIVSTVVWLPVGLLLIDRALDATRVNGTPTTPRGALGDGAVRPRVRGAGALRVSAVGLHLRADLRRVRAVSRVVGDGASPARRGSPIGALARARRRRRARRGRRRDRPAAAVGARRHFRSRRDAGLRVVHARWRTGRRTC